MGSMFGGLTKAGVSDAGGTKYYDSPVAAEQAISQRVAQSTPLVTPDLSGQRIGEDNPMQFMQASAPKAPTISQPTFQEAQDNPSALTTKGKILSGLLQLGQGAALGAGQRDFGSGFRMAQEFPAEMARSEAQNRLAQQEEIIRQNQIDRDREEAPLLFADKRALNASEINRNNSAASLYGDRALSNDTINVPNVGLVDRHTGVVIKAAPPPQEKLPTTTAGLAFVGAGTGDRAVQANNALSTLKKNAKEVKAAPGAPKANPQSPNVESAAAKYWADANGDVTAATAALDKDLLAAQGTPAQAQAEANAKAIRQALQSRAKSTKKSAKPQISFGTGS